MAVPPDVAPFAGMLADLTRDLRRGSCCLVVCDKGWTLPLFIDLKQRLQPTNVKIGYLDGRVKDKDPGAEGGVMLAAVAQMRWAARAPEAEGVVFALPHLDIMTAVEGGWTSISREVIPLLYENAGSIWLGFQDPSVTLPALVEKVFTRRYVLTTPFRTLETVLLNGAPKEEVAVPLIAETPAISDQPPQETTAPVSDPPDEQTPKSPRAPIVVRYPWEPEEPTADATPDEPATPPSTPEQRDEPTSSPTDPD